MAVVVFVGLDLYLKCKVCVRENCFLRPALFFNVIIMEKVSI